MTNSLIQSNKINLHKMIVLIVDPNDFSREFTHDLCIGLGFDRVLTADNTTDAMDLLRKNVVDLIIAEWSLTPYSGAEFVKHIRLMRELPNNFVPIIILTTVWTPSAIAAAREVGANDFMTRPGAARRFLQALASTLCIPRIYIKCEHYMGPCRRHKHSQPPCHERRSPYQGNVISMPRLEKIAEKAREAGGISLEEMEKIVDHVIIQKAEAYNKVRLNDISELFNLVRDMKQPDADMDFILQRIQVKSNDIKGMGDTFGYPLLTKVGDYLCTFVQDVDPQAFKALTKLQVVETHVIVMKMIVDSDLHDEGDDLAKEVMAELHVMIDRFKGH